MRDPDSWHRSVSSALTRHSVDLRGVKPAQLCQTELALHVLARIAPGESAAGAYTLLSGYQYAQAGGLAVTEEHTTMLTAARHLLWPLRRRRMWQQSLESYLRIPARLRAYDIAESGGPPVRLQPTVASWRLADYDAALAGLPPHARRRLPLAPAGRSTFQDRRRDTSVTFPDTLRPVPAAGHNVAAGRPGDGSPLTVTRRDLLATARWMDATERELESAEPGHWEARLAEVRLAPRDAGGHGFTDADALTLDGMLHLVGMVGAGKSTLMILVAVWAARRDLRTTLVVGDVAEQLRHTALLRSLGLPATPVVGASTREQHAQRLHRREAAQGLENILDHDLPAFDDLSTACVVDALRGTEAPEPLRYSDAPCESLHPEKPDRAGRAADETGFVPQPYRPGRDDARPSDRPSFPVLSEPHGCPLWSACPRHRADRELVDSLIWIANPSSLVQTAAPRHLGDERLRYLELACLRSDVVIVDEADTVQMKFDDIFAPSATLITPAEDSWLDRLHAHKIHELSRTGRLPLTDQEIERWSAALTVASFAADRLYKLLISDEDLREWADIEYFSPWTLQDKLLRDWFEPRADDETDGVPDERELYEAYEEDAPEIEADAPAEQSRRDVLTAVFDAFRDDPLGARGPAAELVDVTHELLTTLSPTATAARVTAALGNLLKGTPAARADETARARYVRRLEFMLLLSALHHRLDRLTFLLPRVEAALRLPREGSRLTRRPPLDYAPLVPEAPMGNVLGFQYLPDDRERDDDGRHSGTLRFFRCAGVGRELMLRLPEIGADRGAGRPGPHVVLMSGTSWAGTSTRAHVVAPVGAVLKPSESALAGVGRTVFTTRFLYDDDRKPINLSGLDPKVRPAAVRQMISLLGSPGPGGSASPLQEEIALVDDDGRRRALLLVGSYREAAVAADALHRIERWHGRVRVLVPDAAELDPEARGGGPEAVHAEYAAALRRGDLAGFAADSSAEVLVAPLMAVERGHNILNDERAAAFGTALFLARPHPRPDDLDLAIFAINDWATRFVRDEPDADRGTFSELVAKQDGLDAAGLALRHRARGEWRKLLARRYVYSRLSPKEKRSYAWDQLVAIWQVIGRLVRGGVPARVVFVDARFAPLTAARLAPDAAGRAPAGPLPADNGLLAVLESILAPYFSDAMSADAFPDPADPALVRLLYAPLYRALRGLAHTPPTIR